MRAVGQILRNRPAAEGIDYNRWNEYQLCKMLKKTPSEIRREFAEDINLFLEFMKLEREAEEANKPRR